MINIIIQNIKASLHASIKFIAMICSIPFSIYFLYCFVTQRSIPFQDFIDVTIHLYRNTLPIIAIVFTILVLPLCIFHEIKYKHQQNNKKGNAE